MRRIFRIHSHHREGARAFCSGREALIEAPGRSLQFFRENPAKWGSLNSATAPANFSNCDREPIHIPGSVQAHGFFLGLQPDAEDRFRVAAASENAADYLGRPLGAILGSDLDWVVGAGFGASLNQGLLSEGASEGFSRFVGSLCLPNAEGGAREFQIVGHRIGPL
ncbi:hypothetical protein DYQ86_26420 [Acidobacteria bacterium AB60]|nr:hypothetical protein DYQ86_26420 [Acidobacteria bacterium AB60]